MFRKAACTAMLTLLIGGCTPTAREATLAGATAAAGRCDLKTAVRILDTVAERQYGGRTMAAALSSCEEYLPSHSQWEIMSPLERERFLLRASLETYQEFVAKSPGTQAVFWQTMQNAADADLLDEAIYMQLMDAELAPSYPAYRSLHAARLVEYVTSILAPLPPELRAKDEFRPRIPGAGAG